MNRHFVNYAALPCAPLGEPIRKQAAKPSPETPWKPIPGHPDHVERINAQGAREVTHKDWVPAPPPPPAPAAPALDPGRVMPEDVHGSCLTDVPEGATHRDRASGTFYRHINPGETYTWGLNGWQKTCCRWLNEEMAGSAFERLTKPAVPTEWQSGPPSERGWYASSCSSTVDDTTLASFWNGDRFTHFTAVSCGPIGSCDDDGWTKCWRGPRLTGEAWPEPQQ